MAIKTQAADSEHDPSNAEIMAEINITPLTDVFLVLLIIFMVTTTAMSQMGVDVRLPKSSVSSSESQPAGVVVTLLPNGSVKVNDITLPKEEIRQLGGLMEQAFKKTAEKLVILEGDREAFLGSVVQVMDIAKKAGAERFAIATIPGES